jgi:gluconolactonase
VVNRFEEILMSYPGIFRLPRLANAVVLARPFLAALALALGADSSLSGVASAAMPATVADGARLVEVYGDPRFFEGPTWDPAGGQLLFTAFGENNQAQVLRLIAPGNAEVFDADSGGVNGTFLAPDGGMLGAQGFARSIVRYDLATGEKETLVHDDSWNGPNDICQTPRGDIFFTDPDWAESKKSAVFRVSDGMVTKVVADMAQPNGCIASLDGRTLFVSDSAHKHWRAYPISAEGDVGAGRVFFDPDTENLASPDGMTIDERGNLYFAGRGGVWVVSPEGQSLGLIPVPEFCSNVTFGGTDGKTLYLTCSKKVYQLAMQVRGGRTGGGRPP